LYSEQTVQFVPISQDEIARLKKEKKVKDRRQKGMELSSRKHLSNTRVVQKNLMYVLGLTAKYANEEVKLGCHDNDFVVTRIDNLFTHCRPNCFANMARLQKL
jgi:hypothetical protein